MKFAQTLALAASIAALAACGAPKCPTCGNKPIETMGVQDGKTNVMCPEGHVWAL